MNCTICGLPTGNIVGSVMPQCKCGWQAPRPPKTQRTWVGLTDEEIEQIGLSNYIKVVRETEAKLKQKNMENT